MNNQCSHETRQTQGTVKKTKTLSQPPPAFECSMGDYFGGVLNKGRPLKRRGVLGEATPAYVRPARRSLRPNSGQWCRAGRGTDRDHVTTCRAWGVSMVAQNRIEIKREREKCLAVKIKISCFEFPIHFSVLGQLSTFWYHHTSRTVWKLPNMYIFQNVKS